MLVLSRRLHEKLVFPGMQASIQVVAIRPGMVRLGIDAPEDLRILREELPDRLVEWGPSSEEEADPRHGLMQMKQMLQQRLRIAQRGLDEAQQLATTEPETASVLMAKVNEDLTMLQQRIRTEVEKLCPLIPAPEQDFDSAEDSLVVTRSR